MHNWFTDRLKAVLCLLDTLLFLIASGSFVMAQGDRNMKQTNYRLLGFLPA